MMLFINKIREEELNIKVLNYLSLIYLFSLMTSYEVGSILIYIILVIFLFNENLKKHLINSINNKFVQACILYFSISVVWMLGTEDLSYAYAQIKINKVFLYSILFVAILRKEYINKFIYIFLFTLFINIFWSYLIFFNLASSPFLTTDNLPLLVKTDHSFFILIGIAYSLFRIINYNEKLLYKIIFITLIVLETINIFISNNKTIMILYLIIILFTLVYIFRKRVVSILIFFSFFILLILIILNFLLPNVKNNLLDEIYGAYNSLYTVDYTKSMSARIGMAKYSLEVVKDNILFGVGTGEHALEVIKRINESNLNNLAPNSYNTLMINLDTGKASSLHNTYLQILVQFGILGLIVFFNIFYKIIKHAISEKEVNIYSYLLFVMVLIILVQFNTGWDFQFGNIGNFFILFTSLLISKYNIKSIN